VARPSCPGGVAPVSGNPGRPLGRRTENRDGIDVHFSPKGGGTGAIVRVPTPCGGQRHLEPDAPFSAKLGSTLESPRERGIMMAEVETTSVGHRHNEGRKDVSERFCGQAVLMVVGMVGVLAGTAGAASNTITGNCRIEKVKGRPGDYLALYEWNIFCVKNGEDAAGQSYRVGLPPNPPGYYTFTVTPGTYSMLLDRFSSGGGPKVVTNLNIPHPARSRKTSCCPPTTVASSATTAARGGTPPGRPSIHPGTKPSSQPGPPSRASASSWPAPTPPT